eukprot:UN00968
MSVHDVVPPVRTLNFKGEELIENFPENFFDMALSKNALDHAEDPIIVIEQMYQLIKPGGMVWVRVYQNEAVYAQYSGFHQWNFDLQNNRFVIWRPGVEHR